MGHNYGYNHHLLSGMILQAVTTFFYSQLLCLEGSPPWHSSHLTTQNLAGGEKETKLVVVFRVSPVFGPTISTVWLVSIKIPWAGGSSKIVSSSFLRTMPFQNPLKFGWLKSWFWLVLYTNKYGETDTIHQPAVRPIEMIPLIPTIIYSDGNTCNVVTIDADVSLYNIHTKYTVYVNRISNIIYNLKTISSLFYHISCIIYHLSYVRYHISNIKHQISNIKYHISYIIYLSYRQIDPSLVSLCHPRFKTTNLSYRFPIQKNFRHRLVR